MTEHTLSLSDEQLDRLAGLVAAKVTHARAAAPPMLTVDDIATTFRVSRAWVYANADRLGGVKIGPGSRAPLRFDPQRVESALRPVADPPPEAEVPPPPPPRRRPRRHLHPVYDA